MTKEIRVPRYYERINAERGTVERAPLNDYKGEITGKIVMNLPAYFDENPEERIALGYTLTLESVRPPFNARTQYLAKRSIPVDEHTKRDVYEIMEMTEEMLFLAENNDIYYGDIWLFGADGTNQ